MAKVFEVIPLQSRKPFASVSGHVALLETLTLSDRGDCCAMLSAADRYTEVST